jgi:predicted RNA-binding Zn ribbon-like protein
MVERSLAESRPSGPGRAPGDLEKVRAFVNTLDIDERTDELTSPAALANWLQASDLTSDAAPGADITEADLARALRLREALRGALRSHVPPVAGTTPGPGGAWVTAPDGASEPTAELRRIAADLPIRLEIGAGGRVRAAADGSGGPAALARLLLITAEAATLGTWPRLKVCSADDCRWAFYDRSPTRSGCWCSMRVCGSRAKSRAYRRRAAPKAADQRSE